MAASLHDLAACGLTPEASAPLLLHARAAGEGQAGPPVPVQPQAAPAQAAPADCEGAPRVFDAAGPVPSSGNGFSCMSYNVLLPNSKDGWWIYKYYRDPSDTHTSWPARQALLKEQILGARPDVVCLQETSDLSFDEDFDFLRQAGYEALLHSKQGRMRPATFWRSGAWESVVAQHKDRTLVVGLRKMQEPGSGTTVFVVNVHLSAGPNADRRLRQVHEAVETVGKEAKKLKLDPSKIGVVVCGDFNSQGNSACRELLFNGEVGPDFRESGDPTEKGQEGKQLTSKVKRHALGRLEDAADIAFAGSAPATILATNIASKMQKEDGTATPELVQIIDAAFDKLCSPGSSKMTSEDVDRYLLCVNRELGRGSEFRFCEDVFERSGERALAREDLQALYAGEVAEGKFWGVEHDLREILGSGLAKVEEGPCQLRFDYIYFTPGSLRLLGVQEPLSKEQSQRVWGPPWEVLPNAWLPSDHLPVTASFAFN